MGKESKGLQILVYPLFIFSLVTMFLGPIRIILKGGDPPIHVITAKYTHVVAPKVAWLRTFQSKALLQSH